MTKDWDPRAKPPRTGGPDEQLRWLARQLSAFQSVRPGLPQGSFASLTARERAKLMRTWNSEREQAELADAKAQGDEHYQLVRRFQETRTIVVSRPEQKKPRRRSK